MIDFAEVPINFMDYLIEKASPQEILAYQASEAEQKRAIELLEKLNVGDLTPEEVHELQVMQQRNRFVIAMKARALETLNNQS